MNDLALYLEQYVKPTVGEFKRNPTSARHAILACITILHAADRATRLQGSRQSWRRELSFLLVDIVATNAKHVRGTIERARPQHGIPIHLSILKTSADGTSYLDERGVRDMLFVVQEAMRFLQARARHSSRVTRSAKP